MSVRRTMAGFLIIFLGILLVLTALSLALPGSSARGVGIVIIGPIPIVLSGGADAMIILSLIMTVILIVLVFLALSPFIRSSSRQQ